MVLALGRSNPLKNLPLTLDAWRALRRARPELCLFGIEPELAGEAGMRYVESPSDEQVNELFNQATVFVQTSTHEGFALPPLEAMATGGAVVCTDAHGNRDFCVDGGELPDARADRDRGTRGAGAAAGGSRAARAARAAGSRPRRTTLGSGGSTRWRGCSAPWPRRQSDNQVDGDVRNTQWEEAPFVDHELALRAHR